MRLGFVTSLILHGALLFWSVAGFFAPRAVPPDPAPPVPIEIISLSELTRVTQGSLDAKRLEADAKEARPTPQKEAPKPKPDPAPPPPPPPPKAAAEPPPPEPPPPEPEKAPEVADPIASKLATLPPEPKGPGPEELKRIEDAKKAEEAKKAADAEARRKAEELRKKQLEEKRRAEQKRRQKEAQKKKEEEERQRREAEAKAKSSFDPDRVSALLDKMPSAAPPPAAKGEAPPKVAQKGPVAGAPDGRDKTLSAREIDLIRSRMRERLRDCWTIIAGGEAGDQIRVEVEVRILKDGRINGQPRVVNSSSTPLFRDISENAVRALIRCAPYDFLPADKHQGGWEHMIVEFSTKGMY